MIAILEDDERRRTAMIEVLRRRLPSCRSIFFDNAPDMIAWLNEHLAEAQVISLDHDLGPNRERDGLSFDPGTGRDVADALSERQPRCPVVIATTNAFGRSGMKLILEDAGWQCCTIVPFDDLNWIHGAWANAMVGASRMSET